MTVRRMENVGIVVESLDAAVSFFTELGLELEGRAVIEGDWAERVTGLHPMHVEVAMMRTPDGHSRLEISRFLTPPTVADHRNAPVNALGYLRIMFAVDDLDDTLARLAQHGAQLVSSEVVRYEDSYRLLLPPWARRASYRAGRADLTTLHDMPSPAHVGGTSHFSMNSSGAMATRSSLSTLRSSAASPPPSCQRRTTRPLERSTRTISTGGQVAGPVNALDTTFPTKDRTSRHDETVECRCSAR